ncbi:hypothetical protein PV682_18015 [Streptomyces niveiscabiei]|uniref:hypothetical protein n=1 Tax=Streptomyces niveiscabiei TaxID=164115 RepID=UPI0029AEAB8E|nr:hypothetical protein [Streptomyces niveiscabiei]MDX3383348.1 hypothetical protein [Streptomyces niveiscabiei]
MIRPRETGYRDELLADGTVHRAYEDGGQEWRRRAPDGVVRWRDERGGSGTDELLGDRIVKRVRADGTVIYGRDIGYGRTLWGRGERLTVNRTSFGGRMGAVLAGIGIAGLAVTAAHLPPVSLTPEEEEELRQQAQSSSSGGGDGGGGDAGWDGGDWGDDDGSWSDDDFG